MDPSISREGNIQTARFNGTNFNVWKFSLFIRLREHGLVSIVDGTRPIPQEVRVANKVKHPRSFFNKTIRVARYRLTTVS